MDEGNVTRPQTRRRIIERPRLIRLLDESPARIKMLVAPAGYGKTTLARQWLAGQPASAWYTCNPASADVAELAAGIARATAAVVPGIEERILGRLRATGRPAAEASTLGQLLCDALASWPMDAWLVVDDCHYLAATSASENCFNELLAQEALQVVLVGRERPGYVTSRRILYGEVFEITQSALAMTRAEVQEVFDSESALPNTAALANGWPALVGLAAVSRWSIHPGGSLPATLYDFFAEELYQSIAADVQSALRQLALLPLIHVELVELLLGSLLGAEAIETGVRLGVLTRDADEQRLDMHPLLRAFLVDKVASLKTEIRTATFTTAWRWYVSRSLWDEAFSLAVGCGEESAVEELFEHALDSALAAGRVQSVQQWLAFARAAGRDRPFSRLAAAELALRDGQFVLAETLSGEAAAQLGEATEHAVRPLMLAGRAAHLDSRDDAAMEYYERAARLASTAEVREEAEWGQLMCATDLEDGQALALFQRLTARPPRDVAERVQRAKANFFVASRGGTVGDLAEGRASYQLLNEVADPYLRSSFLSGYSLALALAASYEEGLSVAQRFAEDVARDRLDFAAAHAWSAQALCLVGLREFDHAHSFVYRCQEQALRLADGHIDANARAVRCRGLLCQHNFGEALEVATAEPIAPISRGMEGELLAFRALALACLADPRAHELADEAEKLTHAVEVRVLAPAARAIASAAGDPAEFKSLASVLFAEAESSGNWDGFVTAYRACPKILLALKQTGVDVHVRLREVLVKARDGAIAADVGLTRSFGAAPLERLTRREREVHALLQLGLTNRQIADQLVISEATVKLHVSHILHKLEVATRTAAARFSGA